MSSKGDLASAILDSASTAIILVNRDLRIKYLNPAAEQMLGVSMLHAARAQLGRIIGKPVSIPDRLAAFMQGEKQAVGLPRDFSSFKRYLLSRAAI